MRPPWKKPTTGFCVLSRIKGAPCLVSRHHAALGGSKQDVKLLVAESSLGESSLHNALTNNSDYSDLVAEFWSTIDRCQIEVPKPRKGASTTKQLKNTEDVVTRLEDAVVAFARVTCALRPGQTDGFQSTVVEKVEALSQTDVRNGVDLDWVKSRASAIRKLIAHVGKLGTIRSASAAVVSLAAIETLPRLRLQRLKWGWCVNTSRNTFRLARPFLT